MRVVVGQQPMAGEARRVSRTTLLSLATLAIAFIGLVAAAPPATAAAEKPVDNAPPRITGTAQDGATLKTTHGTWDGGNLSFAFQWQICEPERPCTNIPLQTSNELTIVHGDLGSKLRVVVTATNSSGSTEAASEETATVAAVAPKSLEAPVISGVADEGLTLTVSEGTWGGTPATHYTYEWERCNFEGKHCSEIVGATSSAYKISEALGYTIRASVTAINSAGSKSANSAATSVVEHAYPTELAPPTIEGEAEVGDQLKATPGRWAGAPTITIGDRWERCEGSLCTPIEGANEETYTVSEADVDKTLRFTQIAENAYGWSSGSATDTDAGTSSSQAGSAAVAWGENFYDGLGQIFRSDFEDRPIAVPGLSDITSLASGMTNTLALLGNGETIAWGMNVHGQLGDNGFKSNVELGQSHVKVNLTDATAMATSNDHDLALIGSGPTSTVDAWGYDLDAELGNGRGGKLDARVPTPVERLEGVKAIATGGGSDFAVMENGTVMGWGENTKGQLSAEAWPEECRKIGSCEQQQYVCETTVGPELCGKTPHYVVLADGAKLEHVQHVVAGQEAAYALLESGEVWSWGQANDGQLAQGGVLKGDEPFVAPGPVLRSNGQPLTEVVELAAGYDHVLARLGDGEVFGWGDNPGGELGTRSETCPKEGETPCLETAQPIAGLEGLTAEALAAGNKFSLAVVDHEVYAWGRNNKGQLASGTDTGPEETCITPKKEEQFKRKEEEARDDTKESEKDRDKEIESLEANEREQAVCSRTPLLVRTRGRETEPGVTEPGEVLQHVDGVAAGQTHAIALLAPGVVPPQALVGDEAEEVQHGQGEPVSPALQLNWSVDVGRLNYRPYAYPGEEEAEEEPGEGCGEEECVEVKEGDEGGSGAPVNTAVSMILHAETLKKGEPEGVFREGQLLRVTEGHWTGSAPLRYTMQWQRCTTAGECVNIGEAETCEESSPTACDRYELQAADAHHTVRVLVTASNGIEPSAKETSKPTAVVKTDEEADGAKLETVCSSEECPGGVLLEEIEESSGREPLEAGVPYEVKLEVGEKSLMTVMTPPSHG